MSEINDGGPAFPTDGESQVSARLWHFSGLTKREWFAGIALMGMIASGDANDNQIGVIAQEAYKLADAMLRAGKGENK